MSESGSTPPGWHADPGGSGGLRYWDGSAWTGHIAPAPGPAFAPAPPLFAVAPKRRGLSGVGWALIGTGVLFVTGIVVAIAMLVPRAIDAATRITDVSAQATARTARGAAEQVRAQDGSWALATPDRLHSQDSSIRYTTSISPGPQTASVYATESEIVIAVSSGTGACWVLSDLGIRTVEGRMPEGQPCLASLARGAAIPEEFSLRVRLPA